MAVSGTHRCKRIKKNYVHIIHLKMKSCKACAVKGRVS